MIDHYRAKLVPRATPRGLPPLDTKPIYGDRMTAESFRLWAEDVGAEETARLGAPAFVRSLVPCDAEGNEIEGPVFSPETLQAIVELTKAMPERFNA